MFHVINFIILTYTSIITNLAIDVSHPILERKPNANHVRARIRNSRTHRHTLLKINSENVLHYIKMSKTSIVINWT
jgi:hypothetical protein